ncbi:hypothetical protein BJF80_05660 [Serinicoccus sp. CUA-874]|nr:hypothetical protein BJF80_05660 [Serinicoccus sp. CUA-874]
MSAPETLEQVGVPLSAPCGQLAYLLLMPALCSRLPDGPNGRLLLAHTLSLGQSRQRSLILWRQSQSHRHAIMVPLWYLASIPPFMRWAATRRVVKQTELAASYTLSVNGQLVLVAALAAIGGSWLRGGASAPIPDLSSGNSAFQYVGSFTATLPPRGFLRRTSAVTGPEEWLTGLQSRGVTDLSLVIDLPTTGPLPSHVASGFSKSGSWALLATGTSAPTVWAFGWQVGDRTAPDSRIWSVSSHGSSAEGLRAPQVDVTEARTALQVALRDIGGFAQQFDELHRWASWFTKAKSLYSALLTALPAATNGA